MAQFVMCAALSWLVVTLLFAMDPSRRWQRLDAGNLVRRIAYHLLLLASFFIVTGVILSLIYLLIYRPIALQSSLQNWWDQLNEVWFAQCLLGIGFGAILAVWLRRIYRMSPNSDLSLSQKVEGMALVLLFIVGTTSTPLAELLRGASIETGFLNLKLAAAAARVEDAPKRNNLAPTGQGDQSARPTNEEVGLRMIADLDIQMTDDANRVKKDWETPGHYPDLFREPGGDPVLASTERLMQAAETYKTNIGALTECVRFLNEATGDQAFGRSLLVGLKPQLAKLHYLSLALMAQQEKSSDIDVDKLARKTADEIAGSLGTAMELASEQASGIKALRKVEPGNLCTRDVKPYSADDLKTILVAKRPYLSIIYAGLLQLDDQELTAVAVLEQWREAFERYLNNQDPQLAYDQPTLPWFQLRIYATQYLLFESLFRRHPAQPQWVLEDHLKHLELLIGLYGRLPPGVDYYSKVFDNDKIDLVANDFDAEPTYSTRCPDGMGDDEVKLALGLLASKAIYARRAIQHPAFDRDYLPQTRAYVKHIVNADYGCLGRKYTAPFVLQTRAQHLRVFALHTLASIGARKARGAGYQSRIVRELRSTEAALKLARTLVAPLNTPDAKELRDEVERLLNDVDAELTRRDS